jgi:hypothetical protein
VGQDDVGLASRGRRRSHERREDADDPSVRQMPAHRSVPSLDARRRLRRRRPDVPLGLAERRPQRGQVPPRLRAPLVDERPVAVQRCLELTIPLHQADHAQRERPDQVLAVDRRGRGLAHRVQKLAALPDQDLEVSQQLLPRP